MSPKEFAAAVVKLKLAIAREAQNAVSEFERETGLTPSEIHVSTCEVTAHGDDMRRYIVADAEVGFGRF